MTIYETIKVAISVKQAAEHYGLKVNRNGMACCPFHNDRHPSMKLNEDYFFCFGCGVKGDVIDFVARSFDLSSYEAAQKLAADFGLDPKPPTAAAMVKPKRPYKMCIRDSLCPCNSLNRHVVSHCQHHTSAYSSQSIDNNASAPSRFPERTCPEPFSAPQRRFYRP